MIAHKELKRWVVCWLLGVGLPVVGVAQMDPRGAIIKMQPEVNFGQVAAGTTATHEYVFTNLTGERATINTIGFDDFVTVHTQDPPHPARAVFEVIGRVLPTTLDPGGQFRFTIRFTPPGVGTYRPKNTLIICVTTHTTKQHIHYYIPLVGYGISATAVPPGALTLYPLQDARIWESRRTQNFGSQSELVVAPSNSGYVHNNESRTLIQFDLAQIPPGTNVASATLKLCVQEYHGDPMTVFIYRVTQPWQEGTTTWDSHSLHIDYKFEVARTTLAAPAPYAWVEWDVTANVRNALATGSPHHGWMLIPGTGYYAKYTSATFYSKEGGAPMSGVVPTHPLATDRRPQLVITLGPTPHTGPTPPTGLQVLDQTMCKEVQRTPPYDPITRTSAFTVDDRQAVSWVKLGPIDDVCRVDWEWYTPTGDRHHIYSFLIPHPQTGGRTHWDGYVVWSRIYIKGTLVARMPPGEWEVRIYVNRVYVLSQRFVITK